MKIKKIQWKNFMSYGNVMQTLEMSDGGGLQLICGDNGAGKSTISDVITFSIYGRVSSRKNKFLANRRNKSLYTKIELLSNNKNFIIERGMSPNFCNIYIDGVLYDKAAKKDNDIYIEEDVLGLPFNIFNNIISLSINDFKSFLKNSKERKVLFDKLFNIDILNKMKDMLKVFIKGAQKEFNDIDIKINTISNNIEMQKNEISNIKKKLSNINLAKKDVYITELENIKELKANIENTINECLGIEKELSERRDKIKNIITKNEYNIRDIQEKLKLYENNKCPTCSSDLTTDFHKDLIDTYKNTLKESKEKNIKLKTLFDDNIKLLENAKNNTVNNKNNVLKYNYEINNINIKIKELNSNNKDGLEMESINKILNNYINTKKKDEVLKNKIKEKLTFYEQLNFILSENGVKKVIINNVIPTLNKEIKKNMDTINLNYIVVFDDFFDMCITHMGKEIDITSLSTGESKKLDFVVLMSLIKALKIKYNDLNLLFLDEIFSSLDSESKYNVLEILSNFYKDFKLNVFVINHSELPLELFTQKIDVKKINGFTHIKTNVLL